MATSTIHKINRDRSDERTVLINAVSRNDHLEVMFLLVEGAKVNVRHPEEGGTALSAAALQGNSQIADLLIEHGADVARANRDGNTPLHVAAFLCRFDVVELLLEHGASVETKNDRQLTPVDVVSGDWDDRLAGFYQSIADSSGLEIDLDQMRKDRKRMTKLLTEHQEGVR